jgi:hypothetical protein
LRDFVSVRPAERDGGPASRLADFLAPCFLRISGASVVHGRNAFVAESSKGRAAPKSHETTGFRPDLPLDQAGYSGSDLFLRTLQPDFASSSARWNG